MFLRSWLIRNVFICWGKKSLILGGGWGIVVLGVVLGIGRLERGGILGVGGWVVVIGLHVFFWKIEKKLRTVRGFGL